MSKGYAVHLVAMVRFVTPPVSSQTLSVLNSTEQMLVTSMLVIPKEEIHE